MFAPTHLEGNVELAEKAGLEIDKHCGGVLVNNELMAQTDIYVAGDTASYPDKVSFIITRMRVTHVFTSS